MPEMALQKECLYVRSTANTTGNPQLSGSAPGPLPGCHPHPGPHPGPLQPRGAAGAVVQAAPGGAGRHRRLHRRRAQRHLPLRRKGGRKRPVRHSGPHRRGLSGHRAAALPGGKRPLLRARHRRRHHQRRRCHGDGGHGHRPQTQTENRHPLCAQFRRGGIGQPQGCTPADAGL